MFGNKTLYTTVKCRSMTTKEEFVEMWNNNNKEVKEIYFSTKSNIASGIIATSYEFKELGDNIYVKLELFQYQVALIYLGDIIGIE